MNRSQQAKVDTLYRQHVGALKRQGKTKKTIDAYSRAVRCLSEFFETRYQRFILFHGKHHPRT